MKNKGMNIKHIIAERQLLQLAFIKELIKKTIPNKKYIIGVNKLIIKNVKLLLKASIKPSFF